MQDNYHADLLYKDHFAEYKILKTKRLGAREMARNMDKTFRETFVTNTPGLDQSRKDFTRANFWFNDQQVAVPLFPAFLFKGVSDKLKEDPSKAEQRGIIRAILREELNFSDLLEDEALLYEICFGTEQPEASEMLSKQQAERAETLATIQTLLSTQPEEYDTILRYRLGMMRYYKDPRQSLRFLSKTLRKQFNFPKKLAQSAALNMNQAGFFGFAYSYLNMKLFRPKDLNIFGQKNLTLKVEVISENEFKVIERGGYTNFIRESEGIPFKPGDNDSPVVSFDAMCTVKLSPINGEPTVYMDHITLKFHDDEFLREYQTGAAEEHHDEPGCFSCLFAKFQRNEPSHSSDIDSKPSEGETCSESSSNTIS